MERHIRTVFKTLSWRIIATSTMVTLVFLFTRNVVLSVSVSFIDLVVKTVIYYLHERVWNNINFGRDRSATKTLFAKTSVLPHQRQTKKEREWVKNEK